LTSATKISTNWEVQTRVNERHFTAFKSLNSATKISTIWEVQTRVNERHCTASESLI